MVFKKWQIKSVDREKAKKLAIECDVEPIVALIGAARGYSDPTDLEQFLSDEPYFSDAYELKDIMHAADIVNIAIEKGEKIAVYGDYDCDGVTATALFCRYLKSRNANYIYYIPNRFDEGYGMNCDAVKHLAELGTKLIVTVDNGISCCEEIALANSLGMTVVVTDHHLPPENLPAAAAIVDPHRTDCPSTFKQICGAEVAFKLVCVMEGKEPEELLPLYADILSVAVIADVMPLKLENRIIVKYGIRVFRKSTALTGLCALLNVAGINFSDVNASKIAFGICPRINAAGRMGNAARAVELLLCDDMMTALEIANEIDADNSARQHTEKQIFDEAAKTIEQNGYFHDRIIVVDGKDWHSGVIGIVASRICERYGKPTIVISSDGEMSHGSGRSYDGFSLYNSILYCKDLLTKFGGHDLAAGISLNTSDIPNFRKKINEYANRFSYVPPILNLDCKINPVALNVDLAESIKILEPFGAENHEPIFGVYTVTLQRITPVANNKHLRLLFTKGENSFNAMLFGVNSESFNYSVNDVLDLAVTVSTNNFNGNSLVNVVIRDMRVSDIDEEKLFFDYDNYSSFKSNNNYIANSLLPDRMIVGTIYKSISQNGISVSKLINAYIKDFSYSKIMIAVDTLSELSLIKLVDGICYSIPTNEKTNLMNSKTYKILSNGGEQFE